MADSFLSPASADLGYVSYDTASYGKLYSSCGRAISSAVFYAASGRDNGESNVYYIGNTSEWIGGQTGECYFYSRIVGVERSVSRSYGFFNLVSGAMGSRPQMVSTAGGEIIRGTAVRRVDRKNGKE